MPSSFDLRSPSSPRASVPPPADEVLVFDDFEVRQEVPESIYAPPDSSLSLGLSAPVAASEEPTDHAEATRRAFASLLGMGAVVAAGLAFAIAAVWTGRNLIHTLRGPAVYEAAALPAGVRSVRADYPSEMQSPPAIDDGREVMSVLPTGRSDVYVIKGGFVAPVQDYDFGAEGDHVQCVFVFETVVSRTIERSFGRELVELRKVEHMRAVKLLTRAAGPTLALGSPNESMLDVLDGHLPADTIQPVELSHAATRKLADACLAGGSASLTGRKTRAFASSFALAGKTARVTYADGVGVTAVTPVQCDLSVYERDYFFQSPAMWEADLHAATKSTAATGRQFPVWEISHFFQPMLRGSAAGEVNLACTGIVTRGGRTTACLSGRGVSLAVGHRAWDLSHQSQGGFSSTQVMLHYNTQAHSLDSAEFKGFVNITRVSEDHPLYRTAFLGDANGVVSVAGLRRDEKPFGDALAAWPRTRVP